MSVFTNAYPFSVAKSPGVERVDSFGDPLNISGNDDDNGEGQELPMEATKRNLGIEDDSEAVNGSNDTDLVGGKPRREYVIHRGSVSANTTPVRDSTMVGEAPFDSSLLRQASTTSSGSKQKVLFDMCKYPDNTFELVRHSDVKYTKARTTSESGRHMYADTPEDNEDGDFATVPVVASYYDYQQSRSNNNSSTDMRRASSLPQSISSPPLRDSTPGSAVSSPASSRVPMSTGSPLTISRNTSVDAAASQSPLTTPPLPIPGHVSRQSQQSGRRVGDIVALFNSQQDLSSQGQTESFTEDAFTADDYKLSSADLERREVTKRGHGDDSDGDDDDDGQDVSRGQVHSLVKLYDVSHSPQLEQESAAVASNDNQQHERKPFTSLLVEKNTDDEVSEGKADAAKHDGKENDENAEASYWDQLDRRMSKKKPAATAAAATTAVVAGTTIAATHHLTCTCCGGSIQHEHDNISYFVDEEGDCFYQPDSTAPTPVPKRRPDLMSRSTVGGAAGMAAAGIAAASMANASGEQRVYTHKTLGSVAAKPAFNRYASGPAGYPSPQTATGFMTMSSLPNGVGGQPQFVPVFMTPQPGMTAPMGSVMGMNMANPNSNMSCNQSVYSFQAGDTRSLFPTLPMGQTPMALIPMPMPAQCATCAHQNPQSQPGMQIQYVLAPIMPVMQMPLSQIPEDQASTPPQARQLRQRQTVYRTPSSSPPTATMQGSVHSRPMSQSVSRTSSSSSPPTTAVAEPAPLSTTGDNLKENPQGKRRFSIKSMLSRKSKSPVPT